MTAAQSISVVICTYNGAQFIEEQLESIFSQSMQPQEIILSDDGSSDNTIEIASKCIEKAIAEYRWRGTHKLLKRSEPKGVANNFYYAALEAKSAFIVLCDQDDVWDSEKLRSQVEVLNSDHKILLTHSDALLIDDNNTELPLSLFNTLGVTREELRQVNAGRSLDVLLKRNIVTGATVMMRRKLLDSAGKVPPGWIHDEWFAIVSSIVGLVHASEGKWIKYRQHESNVIGVKKLTFRNKLSKLREPRTERNSNLFARAANLLNWFENTHLGLEPTRANSIHKLLFREFSPPTS